MDRPESDELNPQMHPVDDDNRGVDREITLSAFARSVVVFIIGLWSGAAGGLLLGATAVVMLQSLELLTDNKPLMDYLEKYITDDEHFIERIHKMYDIKLSISAVTFGVLSSALSVAVGVYIGYWMFSWEIKRKGETKRGRTLAAAGLLCLTGATVTGYILGFAFERFLSMSEALSLGLCYHISWITWICPITFCTFTPAAAFIAFLLSLLSNIRLILVVVMIPVILEAKSRSFKQTTVSLPLMLTIYDIYNIAGQQIVSLQSPTATNTSNVIVEAIFVGNLASLMWTVTLGMALFAYWQTSGTGKMLAAAVATAGSAVLGVISRALPGLGPGPTIGALMAVAGAAGVSLSAGAAATDQYGQEADQYGLVGRLGVTVGAAVGAFLFSCAQRGLSGMFTALCAATIPAGVFLKPLLHSIAWRLLLFLWICMYIVLIIYNFIIYPQWFVLQRGEVTEEDLASRLARLNL